MILFSLVKKNPHFFTFSVLSIFFSAPGQTFLISLVIPNICNSLAISSFKFASVYSISTIAASLMLPFMGRLIDEWPVSRMITLIACVFFMSIALFSGATSIFHIGISLFFMRLFGQGVLALFASSRTIKQFKLNRGTALSITQLGYPLSELLFPTITIWGITCFGWRQSFFMLALSIILLYLPFALWLSTFLEALPTKQHKVKGVQQPLKRVLSDPFFPIYVGLSCISPIMMTATLYFQASIFSLHQWPITSIASAMLFYALFKFIFTIGIGPIIDRIGCLIPIFFINFFIGLATLALSLNESVVMAFIAYALFGTALGASASTMSFMWATLYGHQHIGEIKGSIAIIRNGATAIAPIGFSLVIDQWNIPFETVFWNSGLIIMSASLIALFIHHWDQRLTHYQTAIE